MTWADDAYQRSVVALQSLADPERAPDMERYMKGVHPFLGVQTPARRTALREAWAGLPTPSSDDLAAAARALAVAPWRELHYAGCDLVARYVRHVDDSFVEDHLEDLITTIPWWDTVDAWGSAALSPLCRRHDHTATMWQWNGSGDRWLVRSSIQHQRGWKRLTDIELVLALCTPHVTDREFFVAKGIGWALRDLSHLDRSAVERFLADHPDLSSVAAREARRGLEASARSRRNGG